jgi:hypothetical protein
MHTSDWCIWLRHRHLVGFDGGGQADAARAARGAVELQQDFQSAHALCGTQIRVTGRPLIL